MTNENDELLMYKNINDFGYTGVDDRDSKRKKFFTITLPKLIEDIQNRTFDAIIDDSDDLQGEGIKIIIPSYIIDIYTRHET